MKNVSKVVVAGLFLVASFGLSNQLEAQDKDGRWEYMNSDFENGEWHILERCQGIGNDCIYGTYRDVVPE
jgi:hypothetical protein